MTESYTSLKWEGAGSLSYLEKGTPYMYMYVVHFNIHAHVALLYRPHY